MNTTDRASPRRVHPGIAALAGLAPLTALAAFAVLACQARTALAAEVELSPLATARASDAMDGAHDAAKAVDGDEGTYFRIWGIEEEAEGYALKLNAGGGPTWAALNRPQDLYGARERIARLAEKIEAMLGTAQ